MTHMQKDECKFVAHVKSRLAQNLLPSENKMQALTLYR